MRYIRKYFIQAVFVIIVLGALYVGFKSLPEDGVEDRIEQMRRHIGDKVTIDGVTLTIINFDPLRENYKLSNGIEIDKSFVNK